VRCATPANAEVSGIFDTLMDPNKRGMYVSREIAGRTVVTRRIADETILVPVAGNVGDLDGVYTLNDVGSFIWNKIDGRTSVADLAEAVCAEFDVTLEQAADDVDEFLEALMSRGLARLLGPAV
jgi:Coenzyme PQQ synthesis protein D (PqqD)